MQKSSSFHPCNAQVGNQHYYDSNNAGLKDVVSMGGDLIKIVFWSIIGFIFLVISIILLCLDSRKSIGAIIVYLITTLFTILIVWDIIDFMMKKKHLNNLPNAPGALPCMYNKRIVTKEGFVEESYDKLTLKKDSSNTEYVERKIFQSDGRGKSESSISAYGSMDKSGIHLPGTGKIELITDPKNANCYMSSMKLTLFDDIIEKGLPKEMIFYNQAKSCRKKK